MADAQNARLLKVKKIFTRFDLNQDGRLNREEMAALVIAVNPRVKFSDEQIGAILDEVFRTYSDFIDGDGGLSFEGLLRTYDDGAGDVDRDFDALRLELDGEDGVGLPATTAAVSSITDERAESVPATKRKENMPAWAASPRNGIVYDESRRLVEDLQIIIKRLEAKWESKAKQANGADVSSEGAWSRDLGIGGGAISEGDGGKRAWEELGQDYENFKREVAEIRQKADNSTTPEAAFDAHMAIGSTLYDRALYKEALISFSKAAKLKPTDVRSHFRRGNTFYSLGNYSEARDCFTSALNAAEITGDEWNYLLPQIHVNLGIALEGDGMVLSASEHYKEAGIREPKHYKAFKLLGSALYGVGEYRAAEKALNEAIFLKGDYADAHCDLGSTLHAMGDNDRATQEFQKALDLKPDHMDALYNLGGLFRDQERFQRAAEMYSKVLAQQPGHWQAQLNKAVALLGAQEMEEARKAFKEAFKVTSRIELYDAIQHLKHMDKKPKGLNTVIRKAEENSSSMGSSFGGAEEDVVVVEASHFRLANAKTTPRQWLACAVDIRAFQQETRLSRCEVTNVKKEFTETQLPVSLSGSGASRRSIRKEDLEKILRRLLHYLKPDTFQGAVKAINVKVLNVLDRTGSGKVDLGMFFALIAPICAGPLDKRKRIAFEALVWRSTKETGAEIPKADASFYLRLLRTIYFPSQAVSDLMEVHGNDDQSSVSFPEFQEMFDEPDWGFGIISVLAKLEANDRVRHRGQTCVVCSYPITGPWFKEVTGNFSLCSLCYSHGKVPASAKKEEYCFKEYDGEAKALKDKLRFFRAKAPTQNV